MQESVGNYVRYRVGTPVIEYDSRGGKVAGVRLKAQPATNDHTANRVVNDPRPGKGRFIGAPYIGYVGPQPISDVLPAKMAYERSVRTGKSFLYKVWPTGNGSGPSYIYNALKHPPIAGWRPTCGPTKSLAPTDISLKDYPLPDPLSGLANNVYKGPPGLVEKMYMHKRDIHTYGVQQLFRDRFNNEVAPPK